MYIIFKEYSCKWYNRALPRWQLKVTKWQKICCSYLSVREYPSALLGANVAEPLRG